MTSLYIYIYIRKTHKDCQYFHLRFVCCFLGDPEKQHKQNVICYMFYIIFTSIIIYYIIQADFLFLNMFNLILCRHVYSTQG